MDTFTRKQARERRPKQGQGKLDLATTLSCAQFCLAQSVEQLRVVKAAYEALRPYEGKQITKRLCTAIEEALPGYRCFYKADQWGYEVMAWSALDSENLACFIPYDARMILPLGRRPNQPGLAPGSDKFSLAFLWVPGGTVESFSGAWASYMLNESRLPAMRAAVARLPQTVAAYNESLVAYERALDGFGSIRYMVFG
jgi:hypothetical protein